MNKKFFVAIVVALTFTLALPPSSLAASSSHGKKALYIGGGALGGAMVCLGGAKLFSMTQDSTLSRSIVFALAEIACPTLGAAIGAGAGALTEALVERHETKAAIASESVKSQTSTTASAPRQAAVATSGL